MSNHSSTAVHASSTSHSIWDWIKKTAHTVENAIEKDVQVAIHTVRTAIANYIDQHAAGIAQDLSNLIQKSGACIEHEIDAVISKFEHGLIYKANQLLTALLNKLGVDPSKQEEIRGEVDQLIANGCEALERKVDQLIEKETPIVSAHTYNDVLHLLHELADKIRG